MSPHGVDPVGGYADGTTGHSGTETSEARVRRDDASGATAERQAKVLSMLDYWKAIGVTVKNVREVTGWHHGQASAALTNLHKAGRIVRLAEVRDACKVYVLPEYVNGRETEAYASRLNKPEPLTGEERRLVIAVLSDTEEQFPPEASHALIDNLRSALAKIKAGAQ